MNMPIMQESSIASYVTFKESLENEMFWMYSIYRIKAAKNFVSFNSSDFF
jgi:predicted nucleotide-binding protein (sugar kinase/HSP70/actin superfamily)